MFIGILEQQNLTGKTMLATMCMLTIGRSGVHPADGACLAGCCDLPLLGTPL